MQDENHDTCKKLAQMGLGMGVSCLRFHPELLDQQIDPTPSQILQLTMGSGYNSFKTDVRDWYKLRREMRGSLSTSTASPVHLDVTINAERKTESRSLHRHEGQKIHTRTIYFDVGKSNTTSLLAVMYACMLTVTTISWR